MEIEEKQYNRIKQIIEKIKKEKELYKFNFIGLLAVTIHKRIERKYAFYCAEFVKYVMEKAKLNTNLPNIIKPEDFKKLQGIELIYSGPLREYKVLIGERKNF